MVQIPLIEATVDLTNPNRWDMSIESLRQVEKEMFKEMDEVLELFEPLNDF